MTGNLYYNNDFLAISKKFKQEHFLAYSQHPEYVLVLHVLESKANPWPKAYRKWLQK